MNEMARLRTENGKLKDDIKHLQDRLQVASNRFAEIANWELKTVYGDTREERLQRWAKETAP